LLPGATAGKAALEATAGKAALEEHPHFGD